MKTKIFDSIITSWETIKRYKWNSIFFQYLKMFLAVIMILMLIITVVFFTYFYNNMMYRVSNNINQSFSFLQNDVEFIIDETSTIYHSLVVKNSVQAFMQVSDIHTLNSILKDNLLDNYESACTYTGSSKYIKSVSIYSKSCGYILSPQGNNYIEKISKPVWISHDTDSSLYSFVSCGDNTNDFYLCYNFYENNTSSGMIVFRINAAAISNIYTSHSQTDLSITLTDSVGNEISLCGKKISVSYDDKILSEKKYIDTYSRGIFTFIGKADNTTIALCVRENVLPVKSFVTILLAITLTSVILALIFAAALSLKAYKIIDNLMLDINSVNNKGEYSGEVTNEITYISTNILNLIDNNHVLEDKFISASLNLRNLQLDVLQTQLTPHFLFNVLNTLHMHLLKDYGVENITSQIIIKLSELLTLTLDTSIYMVPIEKEAEYTQKYIDLQRIMFDNRLSAEWNIDPDIAKCYTMKFSLQPIVENSISHGIKPIITASGQTGVIKIDIFKRNNDIVFEISNFGAEINDERLKQINDSINSDDIPSGKHIGLRNVNKRIKLIFGEQYGCFISASNNKTTVTVTIPTVHNL